MSDSILTNVKKNLGIDEAYTAFDPDIIMYINTAFGTLAQLGLGPTGGFVIDDATSTWDEFIGTNNELNGVKTYVFLRVKLLFDPPQTSYVMTALNEERRELEWRLNVTREDISWIDPDPDEVIE